MLLDQLLLPTHQRKPAMLMVPMHKRRRIVSQSPIAENCLIPLLLYRSGHKGKSWFELIVFVCKHLHLHGFGFVLDKEGFDNYQLKLLMVTSWIILWGEKITQVTLHLRSLPYAQISRP
jgi:hypothetical protein